MSHVADNYSGTSAVGGAKSALNPNSNFPTVELHVKANELVDMDIITVSDPICVLFVWNNGKWSEYARTEVVWNNLNPEWVKFFTIQYIFEIKQPLMFRVYDVDSDTSTLSSQDFIGEAQIDLSQIIANRGTTTLELKIPHNDKKRGIIHITPEQVENSGAVIEMQFKAKNLKKMHFLTSNSPYFVISKGSESGSFLPVFQSEVSKKCQWKKFSIPYQTLCNCDPARPLKISVMHYRSTTHAEQIGFIETTYERISESLMQTQDIMDEHRNKVGELTCTLVVINQKYTFVDYLRNGVQLNLITAIDFTSSNGDPRNMNSLHYMGADYLNQYEKCIRAVGEILCPYDSDQEFPVFGFGAKVGFQANHCFALNFNEANPCVHGLEGIVGCYKYALSQVALSGPTLFAHIIRRATSMAIQAWQESRTYTILLIVTDGIINDMMDTIDAIVDAGNKPLSIIIVGVGNANFDAMDVLDADDEPLVSRAGYKMVRDLVQFVPFNEFAKKHYTALAAAVLDEVPRQLVEWAELNGIRPV
ncbi:Copine family protein [Trichomonas vaginalis G3]|uniref:Copine family protein n=1 Tax=Trichomonas vaginalis (strain ATCC PRA-98 / G3) TaxID=412133 RepID=A2FXD0_TRIV3|nr:copine family [Trichomonas vaginalis G3]EAX90435.1 Copine family protein [Trichomonas vaginalis G3]KAI5554199.1 copine family [Trichomonas vaginalis G3]|eukprot:XP_001303365.1 Copine family protein [Trichomonas vaginalis G3]